MATAVVMVVWIVVAVTVVAVELVMVLWERTVTVEVMVLNESVIYFQHYSSSLIELTWSQLKSCQQSSPHSSSKSSSQWQSSRNRLRDRHTLCLQNPLVSCVAARRQTFVCLRRA